MKKWHLDVGNSTTGVIGMCGVVEAETREEALDLFRKLLPEQLDVWPEDSEGYLNVYISPGNVKLEDIEEWDED